VVWFRSDRPVADSVILFSDKAERRACFARASEFVRDSIDFFVDQEGRIRPDFDWRFTARAGEELEAPDDPVMVTGTWRSTRRPSQLTGYRLRAHPEEGKGLSVLFLNHKNDRAVPRMQVLFPGEESYRLDLSDLREGASKESVNGEGESDRE